jgi:hypothetical protein
MERKYDRFLIDVRLIIRTSKKTLHGRTKNLAEGGMGATVAGDIPLHEMVELQFQLPETAEPLVLRAEVRYRQGFQYGFRFIPPTEEQAETIRQGVKDLQPEVQPEE